MNKLIVIATQILGVIAIYKGDLDAAQTIYLVGIMFIMGNKELNNE